MLNGKELLENGVVRGDFLAENRTQHGIDIRLKKVQFLRGEGTIPAGKVKTKLPEYETVSPVTNGEGKLVWNLEPGYYQVEFFEGCDIPSNMMGRIVQRSSVARCGTWIYSSIFDAGFCTESMGTFMEVFHPVTIEVGARVAQFYCYTCTEVHDEDLYNGQFQNDKQRK